MSANPFDQTARYAAHQLDEPGFLHWLLPEVTARYRFERWLDTRTLPFPGEPDRTCDTVAGWEHLGGGAPPLATVVEFLVEPSDAFLEKLAAYTFQVRRDRLYQTAPPRTPYEVIGVLVTLTGPEQKRTWQCRPDGLGGAGGEFTAIVRTLSARSAEQTLMRIAAGELSRCVLPWIPLMTGGGEPGIIERWKELATAEPDARKRGDYAGLVVVFAELTKCREIWERALEGWNVVESQVIKGWQEKARTLGLAEGLAKGQAEGLAKGQAIVLANLERVLQKQFQRPIPPELHNRLAAADLDTLNRWFGEALTASSLEDFQARLNGA